MYLQALPGTTSELINDLVRLVWEGLALGVAYGLTAMVIIQFIKDAWLRESFNRRHFYAWFDEMARRRPEEKRPEEKRPKEKRPKEEELVWLAAAGDESMLFSLPIDKMAGQIGVAANAILEAPQRYPELIRAMGRDLRERKSGSIPGEPKSDIEMGRDLGEKESGSISGEPKSDIELLITTNPEKLRLQKDEAEDDAELRIRYADARTRVGHRIQRQIDLLQLRSAQKWTTTNRYLAIYISTLIGMAPLYLQGWLAGHYGTFRLISILPTSIVLSLIGGLLAPLLRDLAARHSQTE